MEKFTKQERKKAFWLTLLLIGTIMVMGYAEMVSAEESNLGNFKLDTCVELYQICDDCSYVNITNIKYPNGTIENFNLAMTKTNQNFNYTFCNTSTMGDYTYTVAGDKGGVYIIEVINFTISYLGKELTIASSVLYIALFIIIILFMFSILFVIGKLPDSNDRDEEGVILSISYLKYFRSTLWFVEWMLVVAIMYLSSNLAFSFLGEELFAQILFTMFRITFGITPIIVIVWVGWLIIQIIQDKRIKALWERGMFPSGRLP